MIKKILLPMYVLFVVLYLMEPRKKCFFGQLPKERQRMEEWSIVFSSVAKRFNKMVSFIS